MSPNHSSSQPVRCAVFGIAGYGSLHLNSLYRFAEEGTVQIAAALVRDQAEAPDDYDRLLRMGCRLYTDAAKLFTDFHAKLDLCVINTSIPSHYAFARQALEAQAHVFVEKPLSACPRQASNLKEIAITADRFVAVGFQLVYAPEVHRLQAFIQEGGIGTIKYGKGLGLWPRDKTYYTRNAWAGTICTDEEWILDSPITNALSHYLHSLLF
ncbi:MAG: Gfo/Idh/MocA family oxidoreductase [Verrucomicrobia bacterium]|jgi:predicted dehydrogenase|nr:Gfo/Idh/MocA family oxidoreductase [Verrucomicrobiota bacterium]